MIGFEFYYKLYWHTLWVKPLFWLYRSTFRTVDICVCTPQSLPANPMCYDHLICATCINYTDIHFRWTHCTDYTGPPSELLMHVYIHHNLCQPIYRFLSAMIVWFVVIILTLFKTFKGPWNFAIRQSNRHASTRQVRPCHFIESIWTHNVC